jgi:Tol biopolymer transport system component
LEQFYSYTNDSQVRISIPKGSYLAVFEITILPEAVASPQPAPSPRRRVWIGAVAVAIVVMAAAAFFLQWERQPGLPVLTTVTSFPGGQFYPALSPDGKQVAFVWRGEDELVQSVYTAGAEGGQPRRITNNSASDTYPAWSPDATRLAFIRGGKGIMIADLKTGSERFLTTAYPTFLVWSPDGRHLVYCDWEQPKDRIALYSADARTGDRRQITDPPAGSTGDIYADFSNDGKRLAFARCLSGSCDIYTMPAEGGAARQLFRVGAQLSGIAWSPDGGTIVYSSRRGEQYQLWQAAADGQGSPKPIAVAGDDARFPSFSRISSGSSRLVYEQHINDSNIWRLTPDTAGTAGEPRRLIASTRLDSSPQVSPDGRKIVFVSDRSGFGEIWTVDVDGRNPLAVTHLRGPGAGSPRWSPDSRRIAFDVTSGAGRAIFVADTGGGDPRQMTQWTRAGRPSWSRDGRWIYFGDSDSAGAGQVFRISATDEKSPENPGERKPVQITRDGAFEAYESADGSFLFYLHEHELRRMPIAGGAPSAVTDRQINMGLWCLAEKGIYFVDVASARRSGPIARGDKPVYLLDPSTGVLRQVASISGDISTNLPDFCVSPDGKALYYSWLEVSVSQIRMIEGGFR